MMKTVYPLALRVGVGNPRCVARATAQDMPLVQSPSQAKAMKTNFYRLDRTCDAQIIATFGDAQLVKNIDGRYKLRGGSTADYTAAKEWVSLFLHEAVVSLPPPVAGRTGLSGFARSVSEYCGSFGSMPLLRTSFTALFASLTRSREGSRKRTPGRSSGGSRVTLES